MKRSITRILCVIVALSIFQLTSALIPVWAVLVVALLLLVVYIQMVDQH